MVVKPLLITAAALIGLFSTTASARVSDTQAMAVGSLTQVSLPLSRGETLVGVMSSNPAAFSIQITAHPNGSAIYAKPYINGACADLIILSDVSSYKRRLCGAKDANR